MTRIDRFADCEVLRFEVPGFEQLPLNTKQLIYHLALAALCGHQIAWFQNGMISNGLRGALGSIYKRMMEVDGKVAPSLVDYLKRVWFSKGIHHHYSQDRMPFPFTKETFIQWYLQYCCTYPNESYLRLFDDESFLAKKVCLDASKGDLLANSCVNYYEPGITAQEATEYYQEPGRHPLNSYLFRVYKGFDEKVYSIHQPHIGQPTSYSSQLERIVGHLRKAIEVAPAGMAHSLELLCKYYDKGEPSAWDEYCRAWVTDNALADCGVDFINGFVEVYNDPLGLKGTYEGLVELLDQEATARVQRIAAEAQWFEDRSPVLPQHRKNQVKGVSMTVVSAVCLAGDCYPSSPIGINLPNDDRIRESVGSKSVVLGNISQARRRSRAEGGADGRTIAEEFSLEASERERARKHGEEADALHTALHECLGHGSGQMNPGVALEQLGPYGSTIEEARADLYALYYIVDPHLVEIGAMSSLEVGRACYDAYLRDGALTQLARIEPGKTIEEAHMRNRALIARWVLEKANGSACRLVESNGKHYTRVFDYEALRRLFGDLLREVQRIKSEGDRAGAAALVEGYGVAIDPVLHSEIRQRWAALDIAAFAGFVNPKFVAVMDGDQIADVRLEQEGYIEQQFRYYRDYYC